MSTHNGNSLYFGSLWSVLVLYLLLLVISHIWIIFKPNTANIEPGQQSVTVNQVTGDSTIPGKYSKLAYRELYRGEEDNPPVLLILHGSPVGTPMYPGLLTELAAELKVIAPDFPGYDGSDRQVPDYSIQSYAVYMKQLLDSLNIPSVHLAGYSLGGGVAINMAEMYPERVLSIDLIASIGVQELELMGSYHLNRAIHGAQLVGIWMLHNLIPHFGLLSDFPLNIPYARSFYDSDQRPLREYLLNYRKPMLIQHGSNDKLVPYLTAQEHHRIVPQSNLITYDTGHALVISRKNQVARDLIDFIIEVEKGHAPDYSDASPERIRNAKVPFDSTDVNKAEGITLLVLFLIIIFSTLISEDLTCIGAGLLAARGLIGFFPAVLACFIGIMIGDVGLFIIGKLLGRPAVRRAPIKWFLTESDLKQSAEWFKAKGPVIIVISRFIPGSRLPTYFSAGVIGSSIWMFLFYFVGAAIVWTPILVGISMVVGTELINYFETYKNYAFWVLLATIAILYLFFKFIFPLFTWNGRRLVLSRWKRITNWEFWPPYVIYAPLIPYLIWLMIRFRGITTFTASNPTIPDGGFIGESKSDILDQFQSTGKVAAYKFLPVENGTGDQFRQANEFMKHNDVEFPVVIKPDVGERGKNVFIPANRDELRSHIESIDNNIIIQKYVPGHEYGVFYYRFPDQKKGTVFSITDKRLPTLTGDGIHTLEELILKDSRAVCMAKYHLEEHKEDLYKVPPEGKTIELVILGTHARGAVFLDGSQLITERLSERIDSISKQAGEFYFGRYDVRVPSVEDFKMGKNLTLLEINGVTSESTHIYDPKFSFFEAQKILASQWKIAFDIGYRNRNRGHNTSSLSTLLKKLVTFLTH